MKKLTYNSIALHNFKHRKKQYILLVIGIILAMVFSSSAVFFVSSYNSSVDDLRDRNFGRQDALVFGANYDKMVSLANDGKFLNMGIAEELGYIYNEKAENKGTYIAKYDDVAKEQYIDVKDGRLPKAKGEISLEEDAYARLKLDIDLGQKFTLKLKPCNGNNLADTSLEKTYTLVGILSNKRKNYERLYYIDGFHPAAVVSNEEQIESGYKPCYGFYYDYPETYKEEYNSILYFTEVYGKQPTGSDFLSPIYTRLLTLGFIPEYSGIQNSSFLITILPVVMCLASCIGIVNTFNSDLDRRKKQIGMYRALGSTKRQIIYIFGRETLIVALICTPVSTVISFLLVRVIIGNMENFVFVPRFSAFIISILISIVCILLASFIPLVKASKVSPMLVVKNTNYNRKMKTKHIKTKKEYNPQKLLSLRSRKFSVGKSIAVSLILAVAIFSTALGVGFVRSQKPMTHEYNYSVSAYSHGAYGSFINGKGEAYMDDSVVTSIYDIPHISEVRTYSGNIRVNWLVENPTKMQSIYIFNTLSKFSESIDKAKNLNADNYISEITANYPYYKTDEIKRLAEKFGYSENVINCNLSTYYDDEIKKCEQYIADGEINFDKLNSGEEIILVVPKEVTYRYVYRNDSNSVYGDFSLDSDTAGFKMIYSTGHTIIDIDTVQNDIKAGSVADLSLLTLNDVYYDETNPDVFANVYEKKNSVKIGAVVFANNELNFTDFTFITTRSGYSSLFGEELQPTTAQLYLDCECNDEIDADITSQLEQITSGMDSFIYSLYGTNKDIEATRNTVMTALVSILILLFIITVSMVNNAFTAQIRNGKRQIGTLRAVGASMRDIVGIYIREFISTMPIGLIIGFGAYNLIYFVLYFINKHNNTLDDMLPYSVIPAILFCVALFAVCSINLFIQVRRYIKTNIVDNIREL